MSSAIDRRIAAADDIADWLEEQGQARRAQTLRGIRASLGQMKTAFREANRLRGKLTPIAQARATEARIALNAELVATADLVDRMAKIADTGGTGPVGIEVPDAAYLSSLLRRAVL